MRKVKIISLGYAVPEISYTQDQIFKELNYPTHFKRIFTEAQIDTRHFCLPPERTKELSFQEQQEEYVKHAVPLAEEAIKQCLDGRDTKHIGLISYSTCSGFPPGPTIPHYLLKDLDFQSDVEVRNLSSQGCEGAFPGLSSCHDFTATHKRMSLTIACELTSLTYYPEPAGKPEPEGSFELLRSNSIFADGCSCALLGYDDDPRHPTIIDYVSLVKPAFINELGYTWRNGRLRVHLSKQVPVLASSLLDKSVRKLLEKNSLRISDIRWWIVHPPGAIVIDKIRDSLGIPEEKLQYSRKALRLYGNCSSSTIGIVGKLLMNERDSGSGYAVMANVGPGMVSNAALLYFGG